MECVCGHAAHPEGPCPAGIWALSDGTYLWACSCEVSVVEPVKIDVES